jgi:hypothetical protein
MTKAEDTKELRGIPVINPRTAGIDVGSMLMAVSYTNRKGEQCLCTTGCFTEELKELVKLLEQEGITDAAMEATGDYWKSLYELLEEAGIKVLLINPGHYKNSANKKTDIQDCQWIHQYHACGILRNSHIAPEIYRELRSYIHERNVVQVQKSETLTRIQRILTQMNVKIQHVVSDIEGVGCMRILRAIASGIVDAEKLLNLIAPLNFKASRETLIASLQGIYKEQYITILKLKLREYDFFVAQMRTYDKYIEEVLYKMQDQIKPTEQSEEQVSTGESNLEETKKKRNM